jgi:redox-sensitive bicupin YhaK (pirin superfamily)
VTSPGDGVGTPDQLPEIAIVPRARDLGGFEVFRALPHVHRQMVGPFIFWDQMGPATFGAAHGMDVRPHPHIGLATVTYLFAGRIMHRDSLRNAIEITPGAMNLMTAGRGIVHSERTPDDARRDGQTLYGIQSWIALPLAQEESSPRFEHFDAAALPVVQDAGFSARVIAGSAFGARSPVPTLSDWLYVDLQLAAGTRAPLAADTEERALYIASGAVSIGGRSFDAPQLLVFRPGVHIVVEATRDTRIMYLGGAAMEGPRHIWWNFVSSRRERIEQARDDWRRGRFEPVPGETEFIPLPD